MRASYDLFFLSQERNTAWVRSFRIASIFGPISIDSDRFMIVGESSFCDFAKKPSERKSTLGNERLFSAETLASHLLCQVHTWAEPSPSPLFFPTNQLPPSELQEKKKIFIFISFLQFLCPKNKL